MKKKLLFTALLLTLSLSGCGGNSSSSGESSSSKTSDSSSSSTPEPIENRFYLPEKEVYTDLQDNTQYIDEYEYNDDLLGYTQTKSEIKNGITSVEDVYKYRYSEDFKSYSMIHKYYDDGELYCIESFEHIEDEHTITEISGGSLTLDEEGPYLINNKIVWTLNEENNVSLIENYYCNDDDELYLKYYDEYTYDEQNRKSSISYYSRSYGEEFKLDYREDFSYSENKEECKTFYLEDGEERLGDYEITEYYQEDGLNYEHLMVMNNEKDFGTVRNEFWLGYDENGNLMHYKLIYRNFDDTISSSEEERYEYNSNGDYTSYTRTQNGEFSVESQFEYDSNGKLTSSSGREKIDTDSYVNFKTNVVYSDNDQPIRCGIAWAFDDITPAEEGAYDEITYTDLKNDALFENMEFSSEFFRTSTYWVL